ncbi:MAG: serine/threonine protein kinase [Deltaproteobacteria bacterium]|nr:serine/threonine protein kinase [Deltaproteobacteria bacterium]
MTRYELLDRIGVGGMAEIFRGKAVAAGGFEKPVAIKRILPHLSQDKRFVELLIAEAKVLSLLKHRNIVQIFDVGLGDDGQYFLVMEYVDGKDLGALQLGLEARRTPMPLDLALHVGAEICEALEHAHTARAPDGKPMTLVHRDVSPSNVLVSRAGEVKLTDFGIAKRAEQETQAGAVRGKFAYISPEQARNEQIEPRSDVFSVGILLWEMITNRRLFSKLGDLEALRAVREANAPRLSEADPQVSPDVERLVMSALSPDPKSRPSAGNLGAKLRSLRYSLEITVGDPSSELAKLIDAADQVQRESQQIVAPQIPRPRPRRMTGPAGDFEASDHTEATVIRIRTADAFATPDKHAGMAKAREVIDRFEEEETRLAQLSSEQLKLLRSGRDSAEIAAPPRLPGMPRPRRTTDEPTTTHNPLTADQLDQINSLPASSHYDADESTRLVIPSRDRRTPAPERVRPPTGTVHGRGGPPPSSYPPPPQPMPIPIPIPIPIPMLRPQ